METKEKFLQYISVERRLSQKTVETYATSLGLFQDFLASLKDSRTLETADSDNIRDWMESMMERKRSAVYVNRSLAALRTFYKYCLANGVISVDPARRVVGPKQQKRLPRFFKEQEVESVLANLDTAVQQSEGRARYEAVLSRTVIYVLYLTGLRASELVSLDDAMIDMVTRELKVTGKRNKQRVIPFAEELHNVLKEYVEVRDSSVSRLDDALFVDAKGRRITYDKARRMVKANLGSVSSLDKCTPHVLRHTFATSMLNNDANLESIKKLLGHQSLETTEIYTHTTFEQLKKIYNEAHPRE